MRRTAEVVIEADGRDTGKKFLITEMPATQAEKWAIRLLLALAKSGADVPPEVLQLGMAGVAMMGIHGLAGLPYSEAEPLLDEMFKCVKIVMPAMPDGRTLVENDIEEVATRIQLRGEVLALHVNFPLADLLSRFREMLAPPPPPLSPIQTSPEPSAPSSRKGSRRSAS